MSRSSVALDNLRAFVILIVLAFHSVLAYLQFLPASPYRFDAPPFKWHAFAIIDSARFIGFDLFCAYQDVYLMSLMFFLSGLFVWPSLARKGSWIFPWRPFRAARPAVRAGADAADAGDALSDLPRDGDRPEHRGVLAALAGAAVLAERPAVVPLAAAEP